MDGRPREHEHPQVLRWSRSDSQAARAGGTRAVAASSGAEPRTLPGDVTLEVRARSRLKVSFDGRHKARVKVHQVSIKAPGDDPQKSRRSRAPSAPWRSWSEAGGTGQACARTCAA